MSEIFLENTVISMYIYYPNLDNQYSLITQTTVILINLANITVARLMQGFLHYYSCYRVYSCRCTQIKNNFQLSQSVTSRTNRFQFFFLVLKYTIEQVLKHCCLLEGVHITIFFYTYKNIYFKSVKIVKIRLYHKGYLLNTC